MLQLEWRVCANNCSIAAVTAGGDKLSWFEVEWSTAVPAFDF